MNADQVVAWRDAAVADGWEMTPTYRLEPVQSAATLCRDGWRALVYTREKHADLNVWGPDGLAVVVPETYSWAALQAALRQCKYCGATDVTPLRVGFGGRSCASCLPEQKRRQEYPGWTR